MLRVGIIFKPKFFSEYWCLPYDRFHTIIPSGFRKTRTAHRPLGCGFSRYPARSVAISSCKGGEDGIRTPVWFSWYPRVGRGGLGLCLEGTSCGIWGYPGGGDAYDPGWERCAMAGTLSRLRSVVGYVRRKVEVHTYHTLQSRRQPLPGRGWCCGPLSETGAWEPYLFR